MTDEQIIKAAESFKLPVGDKRIYENEVENYNYIIVRKGTLVKNNCKSFSRTIEIIYVFDGEQKITDYEIIKKFESIGLNFINMQPDDFRLGDTNKWLDMNTYSFERGEKDVQA